MFEINDDSVIKELFKGNIGIEKEGVRTCMNGYISLRPHPFDDSFNLDKDYGESQVEIVSEPFGTAKEVIEDLTCQTRRINDFLKKLDEPETLWRFSTPPGVKSEEDIIIAKYEGAEAYRTAYREYVTGKYGKYHLILSGIHFNYSFSDVLLKADYEAKVKDSDKAYKSFREYKDSVYLELCSKLVKYGWIITALTQASPVVNKSYGGEEHEEETVFTGKGSLRCSENGYWNLFIPELDYSSIEDYADSIDKYIKSGDLQKCSELHYSYRIKPKGAYRLEALKNTGAEYVELRMIDVNPYSEAGIFYEDAEFIKLFIIWLMTLPQVLLTKENQILSVKNIQAAAAYDLNKACLEPDKSPVEIAGLDMIDRMEQFYEKLLVNTTCFSDISIEDIKEVLLYQKDKLINQERNYAHKIVADFGKDYLESGLLL